ncbi:hypothetical protein Trydic_g20864 [Trypoxylus dichotomus]
MTKVSCTYRNQAFRFSSDLFKATDSKDSIKMLATTGESGVSIAAPDICLKNLPWKTNSLWMIFRESGMGTLVKRSHTYMLKSTGESGKPCDRHWMACLSSE